MMFGLHVGLLKSSDPDSGWRATALSIATLWGLCIVAATEFLSLLHQLNLFWIAALWIAAGALTALAGFVQRRALARCFRSSLLYWRRLALGRVEWLLALVTLLGLACLAVIAWVAAPSNWDSQTYHLSRVMHWIQNQSLAFYPTSIPRQLYLGPGAEIIGLHLRLLSGGDRLANFVQYGAMLGSLLGATRLAQLLGGSRRAQLFALVAAATLPMGILQATSTQNDYVAGFWLVCFVSFGIAALQRPGWKLWLLTGASLGLALLSKATGYVFAAPFVIWIALAQFRRDRVAAVKVAALIGALVLLINTGQYARNYAQYGSALGPPGEGEGYLYQNELHTPAALVSNLIRNLALHLALPQLNAVNARTQAAVITLHRALGLAIDDPRTTWPAPPFSIAYSRNENLAGNPLQLGLIVVALVLLAVIKKARSPALVWYAVCAVAGFLFFCWLLKWQPWNSRLHLPLFVLLLPFAAVVLERSLPRGVGWAILGILVFWSLPYVFRNETRPLVGSASILRVDRSSQYFTTMPAWQAPYQNVAQFISGGACRKIGLMIGPDQWEYPLWTLTGSTRPPLEFQSVNVNNSSGGIPTSFVPCAVVGQPASSNAVTVNGVVFDQALDAGPLNVFVPRQPAAQPAAAANPHIYYVATTGSDAGPGTLDTPYRTIQQCASLVQPGETCFIRAGTYRETVTFGHSGTPTAPITLTAYNRETVTIDGSDLITSWSQFKDHIYQAAAFPDPDLAGNQVFVAGDMLPEARWPNTGLDPSDPTWAYAGLATTSATLADPNLPAIDWTGATAHIWGGTDAFAHQTAVVSGSAAGRLTLNGLRAGVCPALCLTPGAAYYLVGKLAALDSPNEWFYDAASHRLYLWPPGGADPNHLDVQMKQRTYALDLRGRANIQIIGLKLFASSIILDDHSTGNLIQGIEANYLSHYITLPPPAAGAVIADQNSQMAFVVPSHAADSGLIIRGSHNIVRDSVLAYSAGNGILLAGSDNTVDNNVIHDTGYMGSYATAIYVTGHHQTITNNTITNTGRDGITVDWHLAGHAFLFNTLAHNDISGFGLQSADAGGIYLCCRLNGLGTIIAYNLVHDAAAANPAAFLAGLYADNGSGQFLFHHNVVWGSGASVAANFAAPNDWYNNTFATGAVAAAGEFYNNIAPRSGLDPGTGNLSGSSEPLFVDPSRANFTLQSQSPAIDLGRLIPSINDDFRGAAPDAGAYEYGQAMWPAGSTLAVKPAGRLIQAELFSEGRGITVTDHSAVGNFTPGAWVMYSDVDFGAGITALQVMAAVPAADAGNEIDVHLDGARGPLLSAFSLIPTVSGQAYSAQSFPIRAATTGRHAVFLIGKRGSGQLTLDWLAFLPSRPNPSLIEAEAYTSQSGVEMFSGYVGSLDEGDWLGYAQVDFGQGVSVFSARVAVDPSQAGHRLEIHLDSLAGPLLGTLAIGNTGGWGQFETQSTSINPVSGQHAVFLVARGGPGVCNLDWFTFAPP